MTDRLPPIAAQRARNAHIRARAEQIARAAPLGANHDGVPVIVVPANTRETAPLPAHSRHLFLTRLQATLQRVFAMPTRDACSLETAQESAARADACAPEVLADDTIIVGLTCATCRGECCTAGGEHAFLRDDSIARVHAQFPAVDEDALLELYANHLPARHYRGSCVYHTTSGCALPRDLRSNLCNRYVCGGVTQLRSALSTSGSRRVFVGAADSVHLRRLALVDANEARPIPLS